MRNDIRTIVIAGCTRGIGRALTETYHQMGHKVVGCGRSTEAIAELGTYTGQPDCFHIVDICDETSVTQWADHTLQNFGSPDLLICNAGVINPIQPFWKLSKKDFDHVIDVNVKGTANVLRAFLPQMIDRNKGIAITLSSGCGQRGYPTISAYCASKFAIEGLSKSIASELPTSIGCIPISPGVINTEMLRDYWGDERASACDTPETWAKYAAPFLLRLRPEQSGESLRISD